MQEEIKELKIGEEIIYNKTNNKIKILEKKEDMSVELKIESSEFRYLAFIKNMSSNGNLTLIIVDKIQ